MRTHKIMPRYFKVIVLYVHEIGFRMAFPTWNQRLKTRGLVQQGGPPGWLEESAQQGVILYVMDGPFRLP